MTYLLLVVEEQETITMAPVRPVAEAEAGIQKQ